MAVAPETNGQRVTSVWCLVTSGHNGPHASLSWPAHLSRVQVTSDFIVFPFDLS